MLLNEILLFKESIRTIGEGGLVTVFKPHQKDASWFLELSVKNDQFGFSC
jgi:hypothetical protein